MLLAFVAGLAVGLLAGYVYLRRLVVERANLLGVIAAERARRAEPMTAAVAESSARPSLIIFQGSRHG